MHKTVEGGGVGEANMGHGRAERLRRPFQRRAEAVADILILAGVTSCRLRPSWDCLSGIAPLGLPQNQGEERCGYTVVGRGR